MISNCNALNKIVMDWKWELVDDETLMSSLHIKRCYVGWMDTKNDCDRCLMAVPPLSWHMNIVLASFARINGPNLYGFFIGRETDFINAKKSSPRKNDSERWKKPNQNITSLKINDYCICFAPPCTLFILF